MTSPVSPSETIAKAMEGVTPPDKLHVVFSTWKEDGSINIRRWSTFMEFDGSTAYIAEPSVNAVTKERDALALQLEAMQREMAELRALLSRAEEYVIDGVTNAKAEAEMNAAYPSRAVRYNAALEEVRQLYADVSRALIQGEKK